MRKTPDQWFAEYGECHRHPINEWIHWICIPAIMVSLLGLLWAIPVPEAIRFSVPWVNAATISVAVCLLFYLRLSLPLALGMLLVAGTFLVAIGWYEQAGFAPLWLTSLSVFVAAWMLQFVGHKIEGQKPAFLKDVQFLLIGPAWLLGHVYRKFGIRY